MPTEAKETLLRVRFIYVIKSLLGGYVKYINPLY